MHSHEQLITASLFIIVLLSTGTLMYHNLEDWSYVDSFFVTAMTLTTVGYGDLVPTTDISKLFTVGFSFAGISVVLVILVTIGGDYYTKEQQAIRATILRYFERRKLKNKTKQRKLNRRAKVAISKREKAIRWFRRE
jgi:voltage-gated potassium channel